MAARLSEPLHIRTTTTAKLTRAYLQKLDRQNYLAGASVAIIVTFSFFWLLFRFGGEEKTIFFSDAMYAITAWIGALWACITAYRARYGPLRLEPRLQLAWLLIGLGLFSNGIGGGYYTYLEYSGRLNPVPSLSDLGFTLFYGLNFVGLLLMPTLARVERFRLRIALDALITTLCILGVSWYFVIGPISEACGAPFHCIAAKNTPQLMVVVSYPFWDILLILAIVLLIYQRTERILYPSLLLCGLGILADICADTGYAITIPANTYVTGTVYIDTFWFIGFLLIGFSGLYQYAMIARRLHYEQANAAMEVTESEHTTPTRNGRGRPARRSTVVQSFLIYFPLAVLLALTLYSEIVHNANLSFFLVVLTAVVGLLVALRYLLATQENESLLREREQRREEAERLRMLTAQLTEMLEFDPLLTHIVHLATYELGFDGALLLLNEDFNYPFGTQSNLLIRAISSASQETITWRLLGSQLRFYADLAGKEVNIIWAKQPHALPAELSTWLDTQQIRSTLFLPLTYQEKIQGSLGFCRRERSFASAQDDSIARDDSSAQSLTLSEQRRDSTALRFGVHEERDQSSSYYMVHAFTEQAAIAIEHAYLYRAAHEHELFSQALANIAARLNTAIAPEMRVGADIHQLICTEGANALQADYALLYIVEGRAQGTGQAQGTVPTGQLLPVAMYTSDSEPRSMLSEWPPIRPYEYEAQALTSLQPILVQIDASISTSTSIPAIRRVGSEIQGGINRPPASGNVGGRFIPPSPTATSQPSMPAIPISPGPGYTTTGGVRRPGVPRPFASREGKFSAGHSLREALLRRFVHTVILAPLITEDSAIGLLVLARSLRPGSQEKKSFAIADLPQAQDFSEQVAVVFTNARLYAELRNAHRRLQELDQLKDQFMITASHELRTPLTAVQGYLELLAEYDASLPPAQRREFLQKARRGCDELVLLLSNVMDASRLEVEAGIRPAHMQRVAVSDMIQSVIDLIEPHLTQEQREVHVHVPAHLFVVADPARLRQVLLNIAVNALKYSPPGTPLMFSARSIFDHLPCAIISVTDKGKGIKPQDQAKLFQRFVRLESDLNSSVRGSGLGLYISRRLIEAMNGKIWIESTGINGAGSTFHIQLPLAPVA